MKSEIYCVSLSILENQSNTVLMKTFMILSLSDETSGNGFWVIYLSLDCHRHFDARGTSNAMFVELARLSWKVSGESLGRDETFICQASHCKILTRLNSSFYFCCRMAFSGSVYKRSFAIFKLDGSFLYNFVFAPFFKEKNGRPMHKLRSHILPCLLVYCSLFLLEN